MKTKLAQLLKNSYAPYSKINVAAIVVTNDGKSFSGVNVENSTYTPSICAERVAIPTAITAGYQEGNFESIHIIASTQNNLYPCGVCLQTMGEFFKLDTPIVIYNLHNDLVITTNLHELAPFIVTKASF